MPTSLLNIGKCGGKLFALFSTLRWTSTLCGDDDDDGN
jgi:hypothetical protein